MTSNRSDKPALRFRILSLTLLALAPLSGAVLVYFPAQERIEDLDQQRIEAQEMLESARAKLNELSLGADRLDDVNLTLATENDVLEERLSELAQSKLEIEDLNAVIVQQSNDLSKLTREYSEWGRDLKACIADLRSVIQSVREQGGPSDGGDLALTAALDAADVSCGDAERAEEAIRQAERR